MNKQLVKLKIKMEIDVISTSILLNKIFKKNYMTFYEVSVLNV